jgi:hypothetical protein
MSENCLGPLPTISSDTGLPKSQKQKTVAQRVTHFCAIFIAFFRQYQFYKQVDINNNLCYNINKLLSPIVRKELLYASRKY